MSRITRIWEPAQMLTSPTGFLAEILSGGSLPLTGEPIPAGQRAYFQERLKGRIFSFIVGAFLKQQRENPEITKAAIARRLERRPEQINRWLAGPSNMTVETISDLILAVCGSEPSIDVAPLQPATRSQPVARVSTQTSNDLPSSSAQSGAVNERLQNEASSQGWSARIGALRTESNPSDRAIIDLPLQKVPAAAEWELAANNNAPQPAQPPTTRQFGGG